MTSPRGASYARMTVTLAEHRVKDVRCPSGAAGGRLGSPTSGHSGGRTENVEVLRATENGVKPGGIDMRGLD